jgi:predicted amidohydrolase YtcJ
MSHLIYCGAARQTSFAKTLSMPNTARFQPKCFFVIFIFIGSIGKCFSQVPDMILINGKIFTADKSQLYVSALAIIGSRILATGTSKEVMRLAGKNTRIIDLKGKTVLPGFNDAHDHLGWTAPVGLNYNTPDKSPQGPSRSAVLDSIRILSKKVKPKQWIHGHAGLIVLLDPTMKRALDSIAPYNPVVIESWWGHGMVVNSKALVAAGINDTTADPVGGYYGRMPGSKRMNGIVGEYAQLRIWQTWLGSEPDVLVKSLKTYAADQLRLGITTVQNMNTVLSPLQAIQVFTNADLPLKTRLVFCPSWDPKDTLPVDLTVRGNRIAEKTYISGLKYFIDGTPIEKNALMSAPYDSAGWYGRLNLPIDTLRSIVKTAFSTNVQHLFHVVGDSSFSILLSVMNQVGSPVEWRSKRVRIEHNSVRGIEANADLIKSMGLVMMHTPVYAKQSALRSLLMKGINVGIAPDGVTNPFLNILMITKQMVHSTENVSRTEAILAYTLTNAFSEFAENSKGSLTKGKQADLTVLSDDVFTVSDEVLPSIHSVLTIIDGKIVYQD